MPAIIKCPSGCKLQVPVRKLFDTFQCPKCESSILITKEQVDKFQADRQHILLANRSTDLEEVTSDDIVFLGDIEDALIDITDRVAAKPIAKTKPKTKSSIRNDSPNPSQNAKKKKKKREPNPNQKNLPESKSPVEKRQPKTVKKNKSTIRESESPNSVESGIAPEPEKKSSTPASDEVQPKIETPIADEKEKNPNEDSLTTANHKKPLEQPTQNNEDRSPPLETVASNEHSNDENKSKNAEHPSPPIVVPPVPPTGTAIEKKPHLVATRHIQESNAAIGIDASPTPSAKLVSEEATLEKINDRLKNERQRNEGFFSTLFHRWFHDEFNSGIEHNKESRWKAYSLAWAMVIIGIFLMSPVAYTMIGWIGKDYHEPLGRWSFFLIFFSAIQFLYALFLSQIPDWTATRFVSYFLLVMTVVSTFLLAVTILSGNENGFFRFLQISVTEKGKVGGWLLVMTIGYGMMSYLCGLTTQTWMQDESRRAVI